MSIATALLLAQILFWLIVLYLLAFIFFTLKFAFKKLRLEERKSKLFLRYSLSGLIFWMLLLLTISITGFFEDYSTLPPKIALAVLPPIIVMLFLLQHRLFKFVLKVIPEKSMVLFQSFRIPMEIMFYLYFIAEVIPFQMTFIGLNHDILVGVTALIAAYVFFIKRHRQQMAAILWNISGIAMLVNIVGITILSTPSPYRVFLNEPSAQFIGSFPFILIPGFIVPLAFSMHVFSIKQLVINESGKV